LNKRNISQLLTAKRKTLKEQQKRRHSSIDWNLEGGDGGGSHPVSMDSNERRARGEAKGVLPLHVRSFMK
jgi:hypothetical protein